MTTADITWFEYELVGPIETHKYRTNADASIVQYWSDKKVPGFARVGWNRTKSANAQLCASNALKAAKKASPFNYNAPYNPEFLGAAPARAGQDY